MRRKVLHASAHLKLSRHLESIGYDVKTAAAHIENLLQEMTRDLSPEDMLGVVAAGEHSLYAIAHVYIGTPALRDGLHPQVERLFSYHLLEEAEHGAVSHDEYRYFVGNDYWHRIRMAWRARYVSRLLTDVVEIFAKGFNHRPTQRDRLKLSWYLWEHPGLARRMAGSLLGYLSPTYRMMFKHEGLRLLERWNDALYAGQRKQSL